MHARDVFSCDNVHTRVIYCYVCVRAEGRQLAGIILDNWAQGRQKAVWLSVSADLKNDAERDLRVRHPKEQLQLQLLLPKTECTVSALLQ
jgi:P-loop containing NTP hydrolase pore-1